jgi:hypothetical protein
VASSLGYLQLAEVYNKFLVRRARLIVMATNTSATVPVRVNICPVNDDTSTSLPVNIDDVFVENPRAKNVVLSVLTGGSAVRKFTNTVDLRVILGFDKLDTSSYGATGYAGGSNSTIGLTAPNDYWLWYLSVQTTTGANLTTATDCSVEVEHEVEFFDRLPKY